MKNECPNVLNSDDPHRHLGHVLLDLFTLDSPDKICHIDAWTNETATTGSVMARAVRLARALRRAGLQPGDTIAFSGANHIHVYIPFYAAMINGLPVAGVDPLFKYAEIKTLFKTLQPKIVFCDQKLNDEYMRAVTDSELNAKVITFGGAGKDSFNEFLESVEEETIEEFQPAKFDTDKIFAWLVSTSGSTGLPKLAAIKHHTAINTLRYFATISMASRAEIQKKLLNVSPVQWLSSYFNGFSPFLWNTCLLQTSSPECSIEHLIDIINNYKPNKIVISPPLMSLILKNENHCDLTCFEMVQISGDKAHHEMFNDLKKRITVDAKVLNIYGQTETMGPVIMPKGGEPMESCGSVLPMVQTKLINPETGDEITEPQKTGELWVNGGHGRFTEYYNNPEETARAFTEDGWYKTGDLLYRDENHHYYYVDRIKMLIKYRNIHIIPIEIEEVISKHPDILEVGVTAVPHQVDGQHPVAFVVRRNGRGVSARDIKELVSDKLSSNKQLRGGVVFLDELPKTSTGKIARAALRELALTANRE